MGKIVKYMGMSHEQHLLAGDDFGGRLAEGIPQTVVFSRANNWKVDAEKFGLSPEAVDVLVSTGDFKDVSELARIPLNRHQTTFLGMTDGDPETALGEVADEDLQYAAPEGLTPEQVAEEEAKRAAVEAERERLDAEAAAADKVKLSKGK
jgi:hypothetical protein